LRSAENTEVDGKGQCIRDFVREGIVAQQRVRSKILRSDGALASNREDEMAVRAPKTHQLETA
jgi:hypothetical protein